MSQTSLSFSESMKPFKIVEDEDLSASSAQMSQATVLQELEIACEHQVQQMRQLTDRLTASLKSTLANELIKLPKDIRAMSMRDFCLKYGGDMEAALAGIAKNAMTIPLGLDASAKAVGSTIAPSIAAKKPAANNNARKRTGEVANAAGDTPGARSRSTRARTGVVATPSGGSSKSIPLATPSASRSDASGGVPWTPRMNEAPRAISDGEKSFSANGSPLQVPGTIKAKTGGGGKPTTVATLTLGDGQELEMGLSELEQLKAQVEKHLAACKANAGIEQ